MRNSAETGNAPIELIATALLLLAPLSFYSAAVDELGRQLLAEQIARHTIRALVLSSNPQNLGFANEQAKSIAGARGSVDAIELNLTCEANCSPGKLLTLRVKIAGKESIQTMAIQK